MPWWVWAVTLAGIAVLLAADTVSARRPHKVEVAEAVVWSGIYLGIAAVFGACLYLFAPGDAGSTFFAGYLIERILSVDNLFVFAVVLNQFAVPSATASVRCSSAWREPSCCGPRSSPQDPRWSNDSLCRSSRSARC